MTLLTGRLLTRYGENRVIQFCVLATAILLPLRSVTHAVWWMIVAAFLNGASIGGWMVSAPPFLARNTDPERRTWAFSLSYGSSIGTGALAGLIVGFVSRDLSVWGWVQRVHRSFSQAMCVAGKLCLQFCSGFSDCFLLRARDSVGKCCANEHSIREQYLAMIKSRRFILQLLTVLVLWSFFVGSFPPFFNVYFHKQFNQSLDGIGIIFSVSQLCQLCRRFVHAVAGPEAGAGPGHLFGAVCFCAGAAGLDRH